MRTRINRALREYVKQHGGEQRRSKNAGAGRREI
jgi:hypothetical protein